MPEPWLVRRGLRPPGTVALYCFPHAGGGSGEYVRLFGGRAGQAGRDLWVAGVQPPARGSRLFEPPFSQLRELVDAVCSAVAFEPPYVLFGHSLGGLVAFEVARALREVPAPERLIVSCCPSPAEVSSQPPSDDDQAMLAQAERLGGPLPDEVRADPELLAASLACLRADLGIAAAYRYEPGGRLDCPITALAGAQDPSAGLLAGWKEYTTGRVETRLLPGGHFYFREQPRQCADAVINAIKEGGCD